MSRLFDDGSNQYLEIDQAAATDYPLTMACWFYSDDVTVEQALMWIGDKDDTSEWQGLIAAGALGGDPIRAFSIHSGFSSDAQSTAGYSANTWHHACAVFASSTDRRAFIDGGNRGDDTGSVAIYETYDRMAIGRTGDSTPSRYMSGRIAHAVLYGVALADGEVAVLAKKFAPPMVRPADILEYWKLIRDEDQGLWGGYDLTAYGSPTVADDVPGMIHRAYMVD